LVAIAFAALVGCDSNSMTEPGPGEYEGRTYILDIFVYRDFMPPAPDDRLRAGVTLRALDGGDVPEDLEPELLEATLILSGEVWSTGFVRFTRFEGQVTAVALGGPRWPVGEFVSVSVFVQDADGGPGFSLTVPSVQINSSS
jgi:hypothetical protein